MRNVIFIPNETDLIFDTNKNYKHSGDMGDIIYSLPVIRFYGGGNLFIPLNGLETVKYDGSHSGITEEKFASLKPLLEIQNYISQIKMWNTSDFNINIDFDILRYKSNQEKNLCHRICDFFGVPKQETKKPWISCMPKQVAKIVINRTFRYRNDLMDYSCLKENFNDAVFIGLKSEHDDFQNRYGKIDYYETKDLLEAAEVIAGSELFVGNQSVCMAIAIAMGHENVQEYCPACADCVFESSNCNFFYVKEKKI